MALKQALPFSRAEAPVSEAQARALPQLRGSGRRTRRRLRARSGKRPRALAGRLLRRAGPRPCPLTARSAAAPQLPSLRLTSAQNARLNRVTAGVLLRARSATPWRRSRARRSSAAPAGIGAGVTWSCSRSRDRRRRSRSQWHSRSRVHPRGQASQDAPRTSPGICRRHARVDVDIVAGSARQRSVSLDDLSVSKLVGGVGWGSRAAARRGARVMSRRWRGPLRPPPRRAAAMNRRSPSKRTASRAQQPSLAASSVSDSRRCPGSVAPHDVGLEAAADKARDTTTSTACLRQIPCRRAPTRPRYRSKVRALVLLPGCLTCGSGARPLPFHCGRRRRRWYGSRTVGEVGGRNGSDAGRRSGTAGLRTHFIHWPALRGERARPTGARGHRVGAVLVAGMRVGSASGADQCASRAQSPKAGRCLPLQPAGGAFSNCPQSSGTVNDVLLSVAEPSRFGGRKPRTSPPGRWPAAAGATPPVLVHGHAGHGSFDRQIVFGLSSRCGRLASLRGRSVQGRRSITPCRLRGFLPARPLPASKAGFRATDRDWQSAINGSRRRRVACPAPSRAAGAEAIASGSFSPYATPAAWAGRRGLV